MLKIMMIKRGGKMKDGLLVNRNVLILHRGGAQVRGSEQCAMITMGLLDKEGCNLFLAANNPDILVKNSACLVKGVLNIGFCDVIFSKRFWSQSWWRHIAQLRLLAAFCRKNNIDIIYANGGGPTQFAVHLQTFFSFNVKVLSHFHHPANKRHYRSWGLSKADVVVCPSRYTASELLSVGVHAKVVYNGVNMSVLPTVKLGKNNAMPRLCFVGQLELNKRVDWLLRASEILKNKGYQFHFDIVGIGSQFDSLCALTDELNITDVVTFHGRVESVYEFMSRADFHVMASDVEGLGISVIEAALCGTASVVSASTGLLEVVQDGVTGWYFDASSLASLVDVLEKRILAEDNYQYGQQAREYAINNFSETEYKKQMLRAFEQIS
jgi:glycosyltransferase involved in cell wall biosynthesis